MRLSKRFEKLLRDPSIDGKRLTYEQEYACEICGTVPMHDWVTFNCSVAHPEQQGWGEYWQSRYDVCLDCVKAGVASFPDRLRKHAEELECRAYELRQLANAKFVRERRQRRRKHAQSAKRAEALIKAEL